MQEPASPYRVALVRDWNLDFRSHMYMTDAALKQAKTTFSTLSERMKMLKKPDYTIEKSQIILYGAMLKRLLKSNDLAFNAENSDAIGIIFDWYGEQNDVTKKYELKVNPIGVDSGGGRVHGVYTKQPNDLYKALLKAGPLTPAFTFPTSQLLHLLGLDKLLIPPVCGVTELTLYPVIMPIKVRTTWEPYFTMAQNTAGGIIDPDPDKSQFNAYDPPCPVYCYPPRQGFPSPDEY